MVPIIFAKAYGKGEWSPAILHTTVSYRSFEKMVESYESTSSSNSTIESAVHFIKLVVVSLNITTTTYAASSKTSGSSLYLIHNKSAHSTGNAFPVFFTTARWKIPAKF
nr:hypothetical protein [Tanacetum cinerariifolium]